MKTTIRNLTLAGLTIGSANSALASELLSAVPPNAYALAHCQDFAALTERAERNDWVRLTGSEVGADLYTGLSTGFLRWTRTDFEDFLAVARAIPGEMVVFHAEDAAGFLTEAPGQADSLVRAMRAWLPGEGERSGRRVVLHGAQVELAEWISEPGAWTGREGHFAAFVQGPSYLGLFSGISADAVLAGVTASLQGKERGVESPLVQGYRAAGGGRSGGLELYIDFAPLATKAEEALESLARDVVPEPTRLLGLDHDTWLHLSADLHPGSRVDCKVRIHFPKDSLLARLASTFEPLPHALPAQLPKGVESLWALNWDLGRCFRIAREALLEGGGEASVALMDQGVVAARGATGVDPAEDVLFQLAGTTVLYQLAAQGEQTDENDFGNLGFLAHLVDGAAFFEALDTLVGGFGADMGLELVELEGADAYLNRGEPQFDGGAGFLPKAFVVAPRLEVLRRALQALQGVPEASLVDGSPMQARIDENAGATFLSVVELSTFRRHFLRSGAGATQGLDDPFQSQFISSAVRLADGFRLHFRTR